MNIVWFVSGDIVEKSHGIKTSDVASIRYRVLMPIQKLTHYNNSIVKIVEDTPIDTIDLSNIDIAVFSKALFSPVVATARILKERGVKIVFDICDPHFDTPQFQLKDFYNEMMEMADVISCNTETMRDIIKESTSKLCIVIEDPVEGQRQLATFTPETNYLKLLWFGHPSNIDSLQDILPNIHAFSQKMHTELRVVTIAAKGLKESCDAISAQQKDLKLSFVEWSLESQIEAFEWCDCVIIPSLKNDRKKVKSSNRLVESLQAGRMVVVNPIPSYMDFNDFAWIGDDICKGIEWTLSHKEVIKERVSNGQDYIEAYYNPSIIGNKWQNLLENL